MTNFDRALAFTLKWEGGYSNDPQDPGGETKYGISKRAFPDLDIKNLSESDARSIYRGLYWDKIRGDSLPLPVALATLDFAVNSGVKRAATYLQWTVGAARDGRIGPKTLASVHRREPLTVAKELIQRRLHFLIRIPGERFDRGWINRCVELAFEVAT